MRDTAKSPLISFPTIDIYASDDHSIDKHDSPLNLDFESTLQVDPLEMSGHTGADSPYIKTEPNDFGFDTNNYLQFSGQQHSQYSQNNHAQNMNVNPANLTNGGGMGQNFGQHNMGSSFHMGNSGIADDELSDLIIPQSDSQRNNGFDFNQNVSSYMNQQQLNPSSSLFSHTPDGAPIQSPFTSDFHGYAQFRNMGAQQQQSAFSGAHSLPQNAGAFRPSMQTMDRKISESRSPVTPSLQLGDEFTHPGMQQIRHARQSNSLGGGWDSTPSGHSWNEASPFASPQNGHPMHNQISEVLRTSAGQHHKVASSLPTKMEGGAPGFQTQEAKRRRRRESHNLVERRRRDNINERIHDLGQLVPQHRLEDEKVRKHLQTNAPLSPSITNTAGMSPPAATSLLAGPQGRRAAGAGNITQGLPLEDKDKGPNKGDILNGSVAWTRDLMWYMHIKLRQEQELKELVDRLGGTWPFEQSEDEKRMHSEICEILNKHAPTGGFTSYSRMSGSGLRVPGFTNIAGDSVNDDGQSASMGFPQSSLSPGFPTSGSQLTNQHSFWSGDFKEEDEYAMEMQ